MSQKCNQFPLNSTPIFGPYLKTSKPYIGKVKTCQASDK